MGDMDVENGKYCRLKRKLPAIFLLHEVNRITPQSRCDCASISDIGVFDENVKMLGSQQTPFLYTPVCEIEILINQSP